MGRRQPFRRAGCILWPVSCVKVLQYDRHETRDDSGPLFFLSGRIAVHVTGTGPMQRTDQRANSNRRVIAAARELRTASLCAVAGMVAALIVASVGLRSGHAQSSPDQDHVDEYIEFPQASSIPIIPSEQQPEVTLGSGKSAAPPRAVSPVQARIVEASTRPSVTTASPTPAVEARQVASVAPANEDTDDAASEAADLLKMASALKTEVDKTTKDTLSVTVVRKAGEIEQLAHKVRTGGGLGPGKG